MKNSLHGSQHMSICTNTLAVSQRSSCQITAVLLWTTTRGGKTNGSMQSIRKWQNTMALRLFQPAFGPLAIKQIVEGSVGNISTWITAALRNEQFFSLSELNRAIRKKLEVFSRRPSKRKRAAGTRSSATKNCHSWHLYLLPHMNWRNGNKPPFSSIITYPLPNAILSSL